MSNASLNPRDFDDYGDYRAALEEQEWQEDQRNDPDGAKAREAEKRLEIWARFAREGRAPRCIPSCRKPLCLEREGCIWVELQLIQEHWNDEFFGIKVDEDNRLVDTDSMEKRTKRGLCSVLPELWQKDGAFEHYVLRFFFEVWDNVSFADKSPQLNAFCRDVYTFTLGVLCGNHFDTAALPIMQKFLRTDQTLPRIAIVLLQSSLEQVQERATLLAKRNSSFS